MTDDRYEPDMSLAEAKRRQREGIPVKVVTSREEYMRRRRPVIEENWMVPGSGGIWLGCSPKQPLRRRLRRAWRVLRAVA